MLGRQGRAAGVAAILLVLALLMPHLIPGGLRLDSLARAIARLLLLTAALAAARLLAALAATRFLAATTALIVAVLIIVWHVPFSCVSPDPTTNTVAISWFH
jgi:hypothetical protein